VLPAPAQGALAVECRTSDARTRELLGRLEDAGTRACVLAERSTLAALEAGCSAPVAAYAEVAEGEHGPELFLRASVTAIDGSDAVRGSITGPLPDDARGSAAPLAAELLDRGAAELMAVAHDRRGRPVPQTPATPPGPHQGPRDQEHAMTRFRKTSGAPAGVVFVGAGPGDPGMLTARATAALAEAAVVLVDPDVSPPSRTPSARRPRPS
jgi:hypothetical protein